MNELISFIKLDENYSLEASQSAMWDQGLFLYQRKA
jgi:hypothetical protein